MKNFSQIFFLPKNYFLPNQTSSKFPLFTYNFLFFPLFGFYLGKFFEGKNFLKKPLPGYPTIFSPPKCFSAPKYLTPQNLPFS